MTMFPLSRVSENIQTSISDVFYPQNGSSNLSFTYARKNVEIVEE